MGARHTIVAGAVAALVALAAGSGAYAMRGPSLNRPSRAAQQFAANSSVTRASPLETATAMMEPQLTCEAGACATTSTAVAEPSCASPDGSQVPCSDTKPCRGAVPCAMQIAPCPPLPAPTPDEADPSIRCLPIAPCEAQLMTASGHARAGPPLPCDPIPMVHPDTTPAMPPSPCPVPQPCPTFPYPGEPCPPPPCGAPPAPDGLETPVGLQTLPCVEPPVHCVLPTGLDPGAPILQSACQNQLMPSSPGSVGGGLAPSCVPISSPANGDTPAEPPVLCPEPPVPPDCTNAGEGEGGCPGALPPAP